MSFSQPSETLNSAWTSLQAQWSETRAEWNDVVAERFEREFWSEWETIVPSATAALQELEELLATATKSIEED
ncbi:MAG: hypothetical protein M3Y56_05720 [Armatimonadota bacterium]|nr:hypothetical protein [Armatimonadota bacterium]